MMKFGIKVTVVNSVHTRVHRQLFRIKPVNNIARDRTHEMFHGCDKNYYKHGHSLVHCVAMMPMKLIQMLLKVGHNLFLGHKDDADGW